MLKVTHQNAHASCIYVYISVILSSLTLLSASFLSSSTTFADDSVVDQVNITVSESCSMTGVGMDSHTATITNGTYQNNIGTTTLKAFCNDNEGFAIYAIGFTGDQYTGEDHTKLIGASNGGKITSGTATSGSTSNWAMKLETSSGATYPITLDNGYGSYSAVPGTYTKVAHRDSGTDVGTNAEGSTLTTTYAAFMSGTQVADTYTGKVKYTLVHPSAEIPLQPETTQSGKICYYPNGGNVEGTMGCQTVSASATSVTLLASNFSRTGYGFAGWSTTFDYSTTGEDAHFYGSQEDIAFTAGQYTGNNPGLSLYAIWIKSEGNLQDSAKTASVCNSLTAASTNGTRTLASVSALTDARDNQTYAIAKLVDSKCWMIENLRLESTAEHNSDGTLSQGYGSQFAGLADPETLDKFSSTYSANSLYSNDGTNDTINIGTSNTAYRMPRYNNINTPTTASDRPQNPTTNDATNTTSNASMYSYGNYYSWPAVIADTTAYTSNNTSVTSTSICPSGWRLPKGGQTTVNTTAEFYVLGKSLMKDGEGASIEPNQNASNGYGNYDNTPTNADGDTATKAFRKYPNNFVYSGHVYDGSVYSRGTDGYFWSSTAYSRSYAYFLALSSSFVYPGTNYSYKYNGWTVRCVVSGV